MKTLLAAASLLLPASSPVAQAPDSLSLAGRWRVRLDPEDAGIAGKWQASPVLPAGPGAPGTELRLPGTVASQGFGDKPSMETQWTGHGWRYPELFTEWQAPDDFKFPAGRHRHRHE